MNSRASSAINLAGQGPWQSGNFGPYLILVVMASCLRFDIHAVTSFNYTNPRRSGLLILSFVEPFYTTVPLSAFDENAARG